MWVWRDKKNRGQKVTVEWERLWWERTCDSESELTLALQDAKELLNFRFWITVLY